MNDCSSPNPRFSQVSVQTADVKQVLRAFSIDVAAREVDDLNEGAIVIRLRKVSFKWVILQHFTLPSSLL
jgi:hypothetical protein